MTDGTYDTIASIGMAEHVGLSQLGPNAAHLHSLLAPGGRLLNHAISRRPATPSSPKASRTAFIDRYVFPDGELHPLATAVEGLESAGFEVRDVESLREHNADTVRAGVANIEQNWDQAVELSSAGRARVWRPYMAGSALAFQSNRLDVDQVLAVSPDPVALAASPGPGHYCSPTHRCVDETVRAERPSASHEPLPEQTRCGPLLGRRPITYGGG